MTPLNIGDDTDGSRVGFAPGLCMIFDDCFPKSIDAQAGLPRVYYVDIC
jgi:hypothetical protein